MSAVLSACPAHALMQNHENRRASAALSIVCLTIERAGLLIVVCGVSAAALIESCRAVRPVKTLRISTLQSLELLAQFVCSSLRAHVGKEPSSPLPLLRCLSLQVW